MAAEAREVTCLRCRLPFAVQRNRQYCSRSCANKSRAERNRVHRTPLAVDMTLIDALPLRRLADAYAFRATKEKPMDAATVWHELRHAIEEGRQNRIMADQRAIGVAG